MVFVSNERVRFLGTSAGKNREGNPWYRVNVASEDGQTAQLYTSPECYGKMQGLSFGDPMSLYMDISQYNGKVSARLYDVNV